MLWRTPTFNVAKNEVVNLFVYADHLRPEATTVPANRQGVARLHAEVSDRNTTISISKEAISATLNFSARNLIWLP